MCRMIFDFALWSARAQAFPVLLVCEEAHRYVSADKDVGFGPTRRSISRIAKEGRKYGVSLVILGQVERYYHPGPGLDKFDLMEGTSLELVYENAQTKIYRVIQEQLTPLISATSQ
jgi:hypothetical protein